MSRAVLLGAMLLAVGCGGLRPSTLTATAELRNAQGQVIGTATLGEDASGVRIAVTVSGLPPGDKAVHIHDWGRCEPPGFTSAGEHFNPTRKAHGLQNPAGPHAGDLPSLRVEADGNGRLEVHTKRVTLGAGVNSLLGDGGRALVIHTAPDDQRTDPTGNSGPRLACGVIVRQ